MTTRLVPTTRKPQVEERKTQMKKASVLHKKWYVGYSDGSGNSDDGYCIVTRDNEAVILAGTSFGDPYGIHDRELARHVVDLHNAHLAAKPKPAKKCNCNRVGLVASQCGMGMTPCVNEKCKRSIAYTPPAKKPAKKARKK